MGKIENKAIFMLGLPGGGKSTWIENFQIQNEGFHVISADEIRAIMNDMIQNIRKQYMKNV